MQTANELDYLGRIQEIKDGHFTLSSVSFLEYKDRPALMPPNILEILAAVISLVWGVSVSSIVILSKFFLPAFLFLLIYFFVHRLTENQESLTNKINAIGAGMLIVLGYDLVDSEAFLNIYRELPALTIFCSGPGPLTLF